MADGSIFPGSPISIADWNRGRTAISDLRVVGGRLYWVERRFEERGRQVLMSWRRDEGSVEVVGPGESVGSRVYEYGGGPFAVSGRGVVAVRDGDQSIGRVGPDGVLRPLAGVDVSGAPRFGDLDARGGLLVAVRQRRGAGEPVHEVVLIDLDRGVERTLATGRDFYAAPRLCPELRRVCFLAWDHPFMPWDAAELHEVDAAGGEPVHLAGGPGVSVTQPRYTDDGELAYLHDASGFWNLAVRTGNGVVTQPALAADLAPAPWHLGRFSWTPTPDGDLVAATQGLRPRIVRWRPGTGAVTEVDHPLVGVSELAALPDGTLVALGALDRAPEALHLLPGPVPSAPPALRTTRPAVPPAAALSAPEAVDVRTRDGHEIVALHFPPVTAPDGAPPPMIVNCHGGPTFAAVIPLDYRVQFWTSRGFAVLDVDYRGSSGHGRVYRDALYGRWGRLDVADCVDAARQAVRHGLADPARLVVRGESSGGYTALCAAAYTSLFAVVVAHYPVTDPASQAETTHKFERCYVGRLTGDRPPRSPLLDVARIRAKLLLTHGGDDRVVPPEQTRMLAGAARRHGVTVRHLEIAGERHGYQAARSIETVREAELAAFQDWLSG